MLHRALQSESTGTKTFTLFGPAGGGTNLTAFHFETKARQGWGTGSAVCLRGKARCTVLLGHACTLSVWDELPRVSAPGTNSNSSDHARGTPDLPRHAAPAARSAAAHTTAARATSLCSRWPPWR